MQRDDGKDTGALIVLSREAIDGHDLIEDNSNPADSLYPEQEPIVLAISV